ncbi:MAG: hypothetical protein ABSG25_13455, partial [Bryobacteraceae bacterium]
MANSYALAGLMYLYANSARLAPWAIIFRPSGSNCKRYRIVISKPGWFWRGSSPSISHFFALPQLPKNPQRGLLAAFSDFAYWAGAAWASRFAWAA